MCTLSKTPADGIKKQVGVLGVGGGCCKTHTGGPGAQSLEELHSSLKIQSSQIFKGPQFLEKGPVFGEKRDF